MKTLKNFKPWITLVICTAIFLSSADSVLSQEAKEQPPGHVFFGKMIIPNNDQDLEGGDYEVNIYGADIQKPLGGEVFTYGFETGALFSIDSDVRRFRASSGAVAVSVDVSSIMFDYFFGGYLGFKPVKWLRLYVGSGPLLIWARWETEPEVSTPRVLTSESESDFGAGIYARAGIDILITQGIGLNAGVRINETTLSFDNTAGKVDISGWQYYFGMAFSF